MIELNIPKELESRVLNNLKDKTGLKIDSSLNEGFAVSEDAPNLLKEVVKMDWVDVQSVIHEKKSFDYLFFDLFQIDFDNNNIFQNLMSSNLIKKLCCYSNAPEPRDFQIFINSKHKIEGVFKYVGLNPWGKLRFLTEEYCKRINDFKNELISVELLDYPFVNNHGYIVAGVSGSGKSTLLVQMAGIMSNMKQLQKVTTRPERKNKLQENTVNISESEFKSMLSNGKLVGTRTYDGHHYGYSRSIIEDAIRSGYDLILDTSDPISAAKLRNAYPKYFKIVGLDMHLMQVVYHLADRYNVEKKTDYIKKTQEKRTEDAIKSANTMNLIEKVSDIMIPADDFMLRQKYIRDYILQQRFGQRVIV